MSVDYPLLYMALHKAGNWKDAEPNYYVRELIQGTHCRLLLF